MTGKPETVGVRGMQRAVAQQEQLLPPVDEATVYGAKLSQIVVDLAFLNPLERGEGGLCMQNWYCLFCRPLSSSPVDPEDFVHTDDCVWWRAAVLTRPETGL